MRTGAAVLLLAMALAGQVSAQAPATHEISFSGGLARIEGDDSATESTAWGGGSFAVHAGRGFMRLEYEYFRRTFENVIVGIDFPDENEHFHLIGAGWLIERGNGRFKPFFQVGGTFAIQSSNLNRGGDYVGPTLSGGATVTVVNDLFIRPELRWKFLIGSITPFQPGVTVGWRF